MSDQLANAARGYLQAHFDVLRIAAEEKASQRLRAAATAYLSAALAWLMLALLAAALRISGFMNDPVLEYYLLIVGVLSSWKVLEALVGCASLRRHRSRRAMATESREQLRPRAHKLKRVK